MISVCTTAPNFCAPAVLPDGTITEEFRLSDLAGRYVVLFFYPLDFTFVCPSEIIAHDRRTQAFEERGVSIVGVSIDSQFSHHAWRKTPIAKGGIGPVRFPLVADIKHDIVKAYGIQHPDGVALRASFLIDREQTIQHCTVNNLPLGRNVDEMLRVIDALQYTEQHGEVCPAGWQKGDDAMNPTAMGVSSYLEANAEHL